MEEADWRHSLVKPKLIPINDDGNLSDALKLIFDPKGADARKDWIALDV